MMAKATIDYLGKYGTGDSLENPSAVIRRIASGDIYTIEICNKRMAWREDMDLIRYFWGIEGDATAITEELASKTISTWQKKWF